MRGVDDSSSFDILSNLNPSLLIKQCNDSNITRLDFVTVWKTELYDGVLAL